MVAHIQGPDPDKEPSEEEENPENKLFTQRAPRGGTRGFRAPEVLLRVYTSDTNF